MDGRRPLQRFIEELRRRNVFRTGIAYLVGAWLVAQIGALLADTYDAPAWVMRTVVAGLACGLPAALLFAWIYEFTPTGVQREDELVADDATRVRTSRQLDRAIIALLAIALLYFVIDRFWLSSQAERDAAAMPSVAVMPFLNLGGDPANEVLSDGIPETLLTMLAQIRELRVIGRTSSFSFKGKDVDLRTIGEALGVKAILEGSVQRSGERLRINAQLINTTDGAHLWAENYDRTTGDVFAVQDEIAKRVAEALRITLAGKQGPKPVGTQNFEAYELKLRAGQLLSTRKSASVAEAMKLVERVLELDPEYGEAWAAQCYGYLLSSGPGGAWQTTGPVPFEQASTAALKAGRRAVELAPDLPVAHAALGAALMFSDLEGSAREQARALELAPQDSGSLAVVAQGYRLRDGKFAEAAALMRRAVTADPRNPEILMWAAATFDANGDLPGALAEYGKVIALEPDNARGYAVAGFTLAGMLGRMDEAIRILRKARSIAPEDPPSREELSLAYASLGERDLAQAELATLARLQDADNQLVLRAKVELLSGDGTSPRALLSRALYGEPPVGLAQVDALGLDRAKGDARRVLARMLAVEPDRLNAARRGEAYAPICTLAWSGDLAGARTLLGARESVWRRLQAFSASTGRAARTTALARGLACAGRDADALKELEALVREGYHAGGWRGLRADHAYDAIRGTPRFVALVERLRTIADGEQKRLRERQDLNESDITALTEVRGR